MRSSRLCLLLLAALGLAGLAHADTPAPVTLKLFAGSKSSRPDLLRQVLDQYQRQHPHIRVEIGIGGATSELQRKYLSTLLNAQDSSLDALLIDVINPPQYAAAGWIEPLDTYINGSPGIDGSTSGDASGRPAGGKVQALLDSLLPAYRQANLVQQRLVALPATSDAMFMYYRKDLLAKYGLAEPASWQALAQAATAITNGERRSSLQGLSIQGAPIEGTVCTFLLPYWSQGRELTGRQGKLTLDKAAALHGLELWLDLIRQGVLKKSVAEVKTTDTLNDFKAGNAVFAINWGFAWDKFQHDSDSRVRDRVGIMQIPALGKGSRATCLGGAQWAVSAYSRHKPETAALVQYLTSPPVAKFFALNGGLLPSNTALYHDAELLARMPWLTVAEPVLLSAKSRPMSPRYSEISNTLRATTSAVLGGSLTPDEGVANIQRRLTRILR